MVRRRLRRLGAAVVTHNDQLDDLCCRRQAVKKYVTQPPLGRFPFLSPA
jgi:hypothetical protein